MTGTYTLEPSSTLQQLGGSAPYGGARCRSARRMKKSQTLGLTRLRQIVNRDVAWFSQLHRLSVPSADRSIRGGKRQEAAGTGLIFVVCFHNSSAIRAHTSIDLDTVIVHRMLTFHSHFTDSTCRSPQIVGQSLSSLFKVHCCPKRSADSLVPFLGSGVRSMTIFTS